jgi:hypothetical protein
MIFLNVICGMNNTYVLRGENGTFIPFFKKGGFASMGWFSQDETFELEKSHDRNYIKEVLIRSNPNENNYAIGQWAGMVYRFIHATKVGDTIMTPTSDNKLLMGKIISDAYLEVDDDTDKIGRIRKKVEWIEEIDRGILSEQFRKKLYCNSTFFSVDEFINESETEEIIEESVTPFDKQGYVYVMESQTFQNVFKIGKANNINNRHSDLMKDKTYGVFDLKIKGWVKVNDPENYERMFHRYFHKFRLYPKNGLSVTTELFNSSLVYEFWKNFILTNYINNPHMKNEIFEYKFD